MSFLGDYDDFVDTQEVRVRNVTDNDIYEQATMVLPFEIDHFKTEHHTVTGYVEKLSSLDNAAVDLVMVLTEPELVGLAALAKADTNGVLTIKEWDVRYRSFKNNSTIVGGYAKMFNFKILDHGVDVVRVSFRLEFESNIAGLDQEVVSVV